VSMGWRRGGVENKCGVRSAECGVFISLAT
jgi:hypothetical protein